MISCDKSKENSDNGKPYILQGKNGLIWKLHCADDEDLRALPDIATPEDRLDMLTSAVGFVPTFSGIAPIDFVSLPLTQENPEEKDGKSQASNNIWCYCVKCGKKLASVFSRMALQFVVGFHQLEKWKEKQAIVTYYPRLLCHKCDFPKATYTEFYLVAQCFTYLDEFIFEAIRDFQERSPLYDIVKEENKKIDRWLKGKRKRVKKKRKRFSKWCRMCGKPGKAPFCGNQCEEEHNVMNSWKAKWLKTDVKESDDDWLEPKELKALSIDIKRPKVDMSKLCEEYTRVMFNYFRNRGVNVNRALTERECSNVECPRRHLPVRMFRCRKICTKCNRVMYCGPICQNQDWKNGHKNSCAPWKRVWTEDSLQKVDINVPSSI